MYVLLLQTIALVGATVHTMEPGAEPGGVAVPIVATVLIEDGLIQAIGPDLEIPEDARVIELTGLHLIPGLIDGFATFDAGHDALWLASGVTTVRDGGSSIGSMLSEASVGMRDRNPGPALLVSSPVFGSVTSARANPFILGGADAAAVRLQNLIDLLEEADSRVSYFNFDGALSPEQHRVVAQYALRYGVSPWGPIPAGMSVGQAYAAGQRSLIGLDSLLPAGTRFEALDEDFTFEAIVRDLAEGEWRVIPLLMGTARILREAGAEEQPEVLGMLGREYEVVWRADLEAFQLLAIGNALGPVEASVARQRALVKALFDAGVQLVPGSGAPSGGIAPGAGLVDELDEWAAAGVPVPDILFLATAGAAEVLDIADERGRIAPGMVADLVALGSDPRRSTAALRNPEVVMVRGIVRESFDLSDALDALRDRHTAIRAERDRRIVPPAAPMPEGEVLLDGCANIITYGERTSVERYTVSRLSDGRLAYGARVRVVATAGEETRELVVVQVISHGLVESFDLTLDVLNADGSPKLGDNGTHGFSASGRRVGDTRKIAIERSRYGERIDTQRADDAIAAVDGSTVVLGLIAAMHFPEGVSYVVGFDDVGMVPIVDRVELTVDPSDQRIEVGGTRAGSVFGIGEGGAILFAARASGGGRADVVPVEDAIEDAPRALPVPENRRFTGDAEHWAERGPRAGSSDGKSDETTAGDEGK